MLAPGQELVLTGMRLADWKALLGECRGNIPASCWPRVARLTMQSVLNDILARLEESQLGPEIEVQKPNPPIFVLGCWRSGTTWLHRLLARDPSLAAPTGLQVLYPHTFNLLEGRLQGRQARVALSVYARWARLNWGPQGHLPRKRISDNVMLGMDQPAEDEFALLMMKSSDLLGHLVGPELAVRYQGYLTLLELDDTERTAWETRFLWFLKKLTLRYGARTLVLKSPNHTARVRMLLRLFPDARFVHLHRHPFDVYRSLARHLALVESVSDVLQSRPFCPQQTALYLYESVYSAYLEQRASIPAGQLIEIPFAALGAEPERTLHELYRYLGLSSPPSPEPQRYRKNSYPELDSGTRRMLATRWGRFFEAFGYEPL